MLSKHCVRNHNSFPFASLDASDLLVVLDSTIFMPGVIMFLHISDQQTQLNDTCLESTESSVDSKPADVFYISNLEYFWCSSLQCRIRKTS